VTLALRTVVAVVADDSQPPHYEPDIIEFNESVLAPHGLTFQPEWAGKGRNVTFLALAERLLRAVPDPLPAPGLLIVAYALPDPHALERTLSAHLNYALGGGSMSFAVSEQGLAAPFTALRIADSYVRSGRCENAALFILEQVTFPYLMPFAQDTGLVDSGVLLVLGPAGEWGLTGAGPLGPAGVPAGPDVLVVAGSWLDLDPRLTGPKLHRAPPSSYGTSVWLELARHYQDWAQDYRTLVVCDTDPDTGVTQAVTLSRTATGGSHGRP
jgi:hypothetical protein